MKSNGMVYVFTGDGKGKTSAALGVAVRGLLNGWRVCWISLYKEEAWGLSEKGLADKFDRLEMHFVGRGFYFEGRLREVGNKGNKVVNKASELEHKRAMSEAMDLIIKKIKSGSYDLVVVDEINNAINDGFVDAEGFIKIINMRKNAHIILTGRGLDPEIKEIANLVTECRKLKHPYDKGDLAIKGLDF